MAASSSMVACSFPAVLGLCSFQRAVQKEPLQRAIKRQLGWWSPPAISPCHTSRMSQKALHLIMAKRVHNLCLKVNQIQENRIMLIVAAIFVVLIVVMVIEIAYLPKRFDPT